jgi:hypothetical protein
VVVARILGVVNDVTPVPPITVEPPVGTEYQSMVEANGAVADKETVPAPHRKPGTGDVGATGRVLTVTAVAVLVAEQVDAFVTTTV